MTKTLIQIKILNSFNGTKIQKKYLIFHMKLSLEQKIT